MSTHYILLGFFLVSHAFLRDHRTELSQTLIQVRKEPDWKIIVKNLGIYSLKRGASILPLSGIIDSLYCLRNETSYTSKPRNVQITFPKVW